MLEKILEEIIEQLKAEGCIKDDDAGNRAEEIIRSRMNDGWIPVEERLPADNRYILLSFENFSLPLVGRYEDNASYIGDCDEEDTCVTNDLFVNARMPLPEKYGGERE